MTIDVPHWVKYVRWDVIERWRRDAALPRGERPYPYAFGSNDRAFPRIGGGVLWLISSPRYGTYRMPPSVIARLAITDVVPSDHPKAMRVDPAVRAFAWVGLAADDPHAYLPLNNVLHTLQQLRFDSRTDCLPALAAGLVDRTPGADPYRRVPQYFQRHRVLTAASIALMEDYFSAVWKGRRVFVSYRWSDFAEDQVWLRDFGDALTSKAVSCWWDRWQLAVTDEQPLADQLLSAILNDAIRQSVWFVALMRSGYFRPPEDSRTRTWVRHEWDQGGRVDAQGRHGRMNRVAVIFGNQPEARDWIEPEHDTVLTIAPTASALDVARRLITRLPA